MVAIPERLDRIHSFNVIWVFIVFEPGTIAASAIVKLAYEGLVKAGAKEAGKHSLPETVEQPKSLWTRVKAQFKGNQRAEKAIADLEEFTSEKALVKVTKYVDLELEEDPAFADEVSQLASQLVSNKQSDRVGDFSDTHVSRDLRPRHDFDQEYLVNLSEDELKALASCKLALSEQSRLDELVDKNAASAIADLEIRELDELLTQADQLTILKARARYTLHQLTQSSIVA